MDMRKLLKQAQEMQSQLAKKQAELAEKTFEATSGGGMVTVKVNGKQEVLALTIAPEALSTGDAEILQDLVLTAVNGALRKAGEAAQQSFAQMGGGMGALGSMFGA